MTRRVTAMLVAMALLGGGVAGCGSADKGPGSAGADGGSGGGSSELIVAAASSLTDTFTEYAKQLVTDTVRFSFAGSDQLAAQIRQGVRPDVFAAANTALPDALHDEGLVERPVVFATNHLVLAVPAEGGNVRTLADLAKPGVTIAIGSPTVPIGAYTREVLSRLPPAQQQAILANVRSEEPDVSGIVGKLEQGAVDAGFVYLTDVRATAKRLGAILLPSALNPRVDYAIAVVKGASRPVAARRFVAGLLRGAGLRAMRAAGFERAPSV